MSEDCKLCEGTGEVQVDLGYHPCAQCLSAEYSQLQSRCAELETQLQTQKLLEDALAAANTELDKLEAKVQRLQDHICAYEDAEKLSRKERDLLKAENAALRERKGDAFSLLEAAHVQLGFRRWECPEEYRDLWDQINDFLYTPPQHQEKACELDRRNGE